MTETERNLDLLLSDALAENERLKRELKYQDAREGHIGTHGPDCWSWGPKHYECAQHELRERGHSEAQEAGRMQQLARACDACERFFSRYRCNAPDECDCPRCQGYCKCDLADPAQFEVEL